jgi:hypothetical protein
MIDYHTQKRQAWLKAIQPKYIGWDIVATVAGAVAILFALFI